MMNIPKTRWAFCKKCGKDPLYVQESGVMTGSRVVMVGRLSYKKVKITKKIVLRLECAEPKCISKRILTIKRYKRF